MTLGQIVGDPLRANRIATGSELEDRVADMLTRVGCHPKYMRRYPHAFSGGERQRVNIARALILRPRLVVADEPVSALDVSVRAQILNLLRDLQAEFDLTYLFISHDLSVVESICDRVAVMYFGHIVELASTSDLYARPRHPYTEALLSAVPRPDPRLRDAGPAHPPARRPARPDQPAGRLLPSTPDAATSDRRSVPFPVASRALREIDPGHTAACHFADELSLASPNRQPDRIAMIQSRGQTCRRPHMP